MAEIKSLLKFWNLIHYEIYVFNKNAHKAFNLINPVIWFSKIDRVKKFHSEQGVKDWEKFVDRTVFDNKKTGINVIRSGIQIGTLVGLFFCSLINFGQFILKTDLVGYIWSDNIRGPIFVVLVVVGAGIINYFLLFKQDRYLVYFKEFEKLTKRKKTKNNIIGFAFVLMILGFFVLSIIALTYSFG